MDCKSRDITIDCASIVGYPDTGDKHDGESKMIPPAIDLDQPMVLLASSVLDGMDQTLVDTGNREAFTIMQVGDDGRPHIVMCSESMVTEIMQHMTAWMQIGV